MYAKIAIVGMSGRFPGASSVEALWRNICAGQNALIPTEAEDTSGPADEASGYWVRHDSLLPDIASFDAKFFGFNPREAALCDPQHRIFLECAWEALEDGGGLPSNGRRVVGVYGGANSSQYFPVPLEAGRFLDALPLWIGTESDYLTTKVAHNLGLAGPAFTVQCGCSTSLVAVHLACQALQAGECDAALAGGVAITMPRANRHFYMDGGMLSTEPFVRSFDADARGTIFSEGAGVVHLMRLEDALKDRRQIYAVLVSSVVNNDADADVGFSAPSPAGQGRLLQRAYEVAGVSPKDIDYVEAHGTGTVVGDAVELEALTKAFRRATDRAGFCGLGSVKANIGHLSAASGVAGLIKAALVAKHGVVPPHPHFHRPHPSLDLNTSPFYVNTDAVRLRTEGQPRRVAVSSFGVGGTNAHVILEEPPQIRATASERLWHVLPLSAQTEPALVEMRARHADALERNAAASLADVAYTQAVGREEFEYRSVAICRDREDAVAVLREIVPDRILTRRAKGELPKIAFMFPGQGAQFPHMGRELYRDEPTFRRHADECLALFKTQSAVDLAEVLYGDGRSSQALAAEIERTEIAQPALFTTGYALSRLFMSYGVQPAALIGHSIGEYLAACLSGALGLDDAVRMVAHRGRLMQQMSPGRMISVALAHDELKRRLPPGLDIAALNAPGSTVVAGESDDLAALERDLDAAGVSYRRLHTSHAFHSRSMEPMLEEFLQVARTAAIGSASVPFISNVTGRDMPMSELHDPTYWCRQIRMPVKFAEGIRALSDAGVNHFLEIGPGRTLATLAKHNGIGKAGERVLSAMPGPDNPASESVAFLRAVGAVWLSGGRVDWGQRYDGESPRRTSLPAYPFQRKRYWVEAADGSRGEGGPSADEKLPSDAWLNVPSWRRLAPLMCCTNAPEPEGARTVHLLLVDKLATGQQWRTRLGLAPEDSPIAIAAKVFCEVGDGAYELDPTEPEDFAALVAAARLNAGDRMRVIHGWTASPPSEVFTDFERSQTLGIYCLQRILREVLAADDSMAIEFVVVSSGLAEVIGGEVLHPYNASILGFTRVAPLERSNVRCRVIDTDGTLDAFVEKHAAELRQNRDEPIIALRGAYRWVQRFERAGPGEVTSGAPEAAGLKIGGTYLIFGGLGHIGLDLAERLARDWSANLILVARTQLPPRATWAVDLEAGVFAAADQDRIRRLLEIERTAASLKIISTDVSDRSAMAALREMIEQASLRLDGIVFAAGRLLSSLTGCSETGLMEYKRHFSGKAIGVDALIETFGEVPLDFCVIFSSIGTLAPVVGQCAYAGANQVADLLVWNRNRKADRAWITVNWDLWQDTGLGWKNDKLQSWKDRETGEGVSDLATRVARAGRLAITPEEGLETLQRIIRMGATQVAISTQDLWPRIVETLTPTVTVEETTTEGSDARPELDNPYVPPVGEGEILLVKIWEETLGIASIGRHDEFFDLGGHSLMAVRIVSKIKTALGVELRLEQFFAAATIANLSQVVGCDVSASDPVAAPELA